MPTASTVASKATFNYQKGRTSDARPKTEGFIQGLGLGMESCQRHVWHHGNAVHENGRAMLAPTLIARWCTFALSRLIRRLRRHLLPLEKAMLRSLHRSYFCGDGRAMLAPKPKVLSKALALVWNRANGTYGITATPCMKTDERCSPLQKTKKEFRQGEIPFSFSLLYTIYMI